VEDGDEVDEEALSEEYRRGHVQRAARRTAARTRQLQCSFAADALVCSPALASAFREQLLELSTQRAEAEALYAVRTRHARTRTHRRR
jgi:hypothetical protein